MDAETMPELLHPDDLLRMPDGDNYELIEGVLKEQPMGAESEEAAGLLLTLLNIFIRPKKLGRAYPSNTGFQCFPHKPRSVRKPDASFVAAGRLPNDRSPAGHIKTPPDIAVEVVSPGDTYDELEVKVADYRLAGVKLIWVISPVAKTVLIRRLDGSCAELTEAGELSGEDVLPGFTCKVAELFV